MSLVMARFSTFSASSCIAPSLLGVLWYSVRAEYLLPSQLVADHALLSRCRATTSPTLALFRAPNVRIHFTPTTPSCSARREQSRRPEAGNCGTYGEPSTLPISPEPYFPDCRTVCKLQCSVLMCTTCEDHTCAVSSLLSTFATMDMRGISAEPSQGGLYHILPVNNSEPLLGRPGGRLLCRAIHMEHRRRRIWSE